MVKFGYNIDSSSISFERAVEAIRNSGASTHLIMVSNRTYFYRQGEIDTIVRYCQTFPEMTFIVRLFHDSQGDWKAYPKASEYQTNWAWARQKLGEYANRVIFDAPPNEPNLPDNSNANHPDVAAFVKRCVDWVKAASNAGVKLAVGAFAVGTLQESVLSTTYKPLWEALKQYKQAISYHGYGAIPFEAGETAPLNIVLDAKAARAYMKDERWSMSHGGYLLAEPYRIIQVCEAMGFTPEIYLTECIVDNVLGQQPEVKEAWRAEYGIDMFMRDPRGVRTWERYLKEFMPEKAFDEAIAALLKHARKNIYYHPAFKAACLFALNRQWDYGYDGFLDGTNKHAGSNYDRPEFTRFRSTLLPKLNAEIYEDIPMPTPTNLIPARIKSTVADGTRIRETPITGNRLGLIPPTFTDGLVQADWENVAWPYVDVLGVRGYASKDFLVIEEIAEPPTERMYIVDAPAGGTQILPESVLDAMIEYQELALAGLKIIRNAPE